MNHWIFAVVKWILAIVLTFSMASYQRMTGPTYPQDLEFSIQNEFYQFELPRSHSSTAPCEISVPATNPEISGELHFRRYKVDESWTIMPLMVEDNSLKGYLPPQPPAGKLEYFLTLKTQNQEIVLPEESAVVIRFKGDVPASFLLPHVLLMFISMLLAAVSLMEILFKGEKVKIYTLLTTVTLFLGGMIFGPIVQKFAFGAYWTGIPFGWDLTDNKTLLSFLFWLAALWQIYRPNAKKAKLWVIAAIIVMFGIYLIPHSTMGSELNYETMQVETGNL